MKRKLSARRWLVFLLVLLALLAVAFFITKYYLSQDAVTEREKAKLPTPSAGQSPVSSAQSPVENPINTPIPEELNLNVPFTSQAPHANWDYTHEEACEEAAVLMAGRYFRGQGISGADDAEKSLQEIISWEKENLGFFESTTAEETARVIKGIYGLNAQVIENPTVEQIKRALAERKLVLSPSAGREIGNPFYKSPGPLYHMLLIKGYTKDKFITNDAGTKRGENYPYVFKTVLDANHDWNGGNVGDGRKLMIVVSR